MRQLTLGFLQTRLRPLRIRAQLERFGEISPRRLVILLVDLQLSHRQQSLQLFDLFDSRVDRRLVSRWRIGLQVSLEELDRFGVSLLLFGLARLLQMRVWRSSSRSWSDRRMRCAASRRTATTQQQEVNGGCNGADDQHEDNASDQQSGA